MARLPEALQLRNGLSIKRISVAPHGPEEKCAVRALLWGPSGECEILGVPPGLIAPRSLKEALESSVRERLEYFERLLAAIMGFSNTFGGRIFLGVQAQIENERFPGKISLPESLESYNLAGLIQKKVLDFKMGEIAQRCLRSFDASRLGLGGPVAGEPGRDVTSATQGKILSLADCLDLENLLVHWYNQRYGRKYRLSLHQLLNNEWITFNTMPGPGEDELCYLRVNPIKNGEVTHKRYSSGDLFFRIDKESARRGNLVGVNWSIYQSQRGYSDSCIGSEKPEYFDGPDWPLDRSDPKVTFEDFCYVSRESDRPSWQERLIDRANFIEFYQTLSLDRRSELAQTLTEMIWSHVGGLEGAKMYRKVLHRLELAELSGKHLNADYQRDHVIHSCNVFFLGAYLWQSSRIIRDRLSLVPNSRAIWAMAATWHDIGYPFELFLWTLREELRLFKDISGSVLFPPLQSGLNEAGHDNVFEGSFWSRMEQSLSHPVGSISRQFNRKIEQTGLINHGIVSAMLLENLAGKLYVNGFWHRYHVDLVKVAAPAVAAHDLEVREANAPEGKEPPSPQRNQPFTLEAQPIPYLLILCDSFQEWDRSAISRHILIPSSVNLKVMAGKEGQETIRCCMTVDSKRAHDIDAELARKVSTSPPLRICVKAYNPILNQLHEEIANRKAAIPLIVQADFVPMGSQLEPKKATLVLDVGGKLEKGIIDHHQVGAPPHSCASLLVHKHPEYVLEHLSGAHPGKVTFVIHKSPDFDAICSFFLARRLLLHGDIPERWQALIEYALEVDTARLKLDETMIRRSPYAILAAITHLHRNDLDRLNRGLSLMHYLATWLEGEPGRSLRDDQLFPGGHPFEAEQAFIGRDYDDYLYDLGGAQKHAITLRKLHSGIEETVDLVIVVSPRSQLFKVWARLDRTNSPSKRGFIATVVHHRVGTADHNRCIISVDPSLPRDDLLSIAGLGEALTQLEDVKRNLRQVTPIPLQPRRRGYPNQDPWYDGRGSSFNFTIVDSPGRGSALTMDEINDLVLQPELWLHRDGAAYLDELVKKYEDAET